ncbi:hypothetical protein AB205_0146990, partial [Aquarana catesbeiana]
ITSGEMYMVFSKRLYSRSECNNYVAALYKVIGTFLFGASVSQSLTDLAKYMIGRPRPNFIAVCDPDWKMINCSGYVTELECRGSHANLYIQARLCGKWARLLRPTVQFFLLSFALYVGYTRVSDYKHHWSDVLVGLLQGAVVATLTVRYVSDFFKVRPPLQCTKDPLETKPSLQLCETDQNHFGYLGGS